MESTSERASQQSWFQPEPAKLVEISINGENNWTHRSYCSCSSPFAGFKPYHPWLWPLDCLLFVQLYISSFQLLHNLSTTCCTSGLKKGWLETNHLSKMLKTVFNFSWTEKPWTSMQSPDGTTVVSGAGDETLRFWKVFGTPQPVKKVSLSRPGGLSMRSIRIR